VSTGYELTGVWQSDAALTVAVGRYSPDGAQWRQAILMNTGAGWADADTPGAAPRMFDVWGSADDNIFAVGWGGEILHYNGSTWSIMSSSTDDAAFLHSVAGTSGSSIIAVGRTNDLHGLVARYDGSCWQSTVIPDSEELYGICTIGQTEAFAVGSLGSICRFDGTKWKAMHSPTNEALFGVWGVKPDDVYAVGWEGTLLHFDGMSWRELLIATNRSLHGIAGDAASGDVLLVGDRGAIIKCPSVQ
jgi:hypothetical protein